LTDSALFGSVLAAEAARIPCALLSPTISLRPLPGVPPVGSGLPAPNTPEARIEIEAANCRFLSVMNHWLPMLNEARASLHLAAYHARDFRDALQRVARFKQLCAPERSDLIGLAFRKQDSVRMT
jgi:hypothetical protein